MLSKHLCVASMVSVLLLRAGLPTTGIGSSVRGQSLPDAEKLYRSGQFEEALSEALQYRKLAVELLKNDPTRRNQVLQKTAMVLADIYLALHRFADAEKVLQVEIAKIVKPRRVDERVLRLRLEEKLAHVAVAQGDRRKIAERWSQVYRHAKAALDAIEQERRLARFEPQIVTALLLSDQNIARVFFTERDYFRARAHLERGLGVQRKWPDRPVSVEQWSWIAYHKAQLLADLAAVNKADGRREDAKKQWRDASRIYADLILATQRANNSRLDAMQLRDHLQAVYQQLGQYHEAIEVNHALLKLRSQRLGQQHRLTYRTRSNLGALYGAIMDYPRAREYLADARSYWERHDRPPRLELARALNDLAVVEQAIGSTSDAQDLFQRSLRIRQQYLPAEDVRLAYSYSNLASVHSAKGEFHQAVRLYHRAIDIHRQRQDMDDDALCNALLNVAMTYKSQGLWDQATEHCQAALQVYQDAFGAKSVGAVAHYNALASLSIGQAMKTRSIDRGKLGEALAFNQLALEICQLHQMQADPVRASALHLKATIAYLQEEFDSARRLWEVALEIQQANNEKAHQARSLNFLGNVATRQGQLDKAVEHYERALAIGETVQAYPTRRYLTHYSLAELLYRRNQLDRARRLLEKAIDIIEIPRAGTVGAEVGRAEYFQGFASAFDRLVAWSRQEGRIDDALMYAERGRNRTLLDQLRVSGVDLRTTLSSDDKKRLLKKEREVWADFQKRRGRIMFAAGDTSPQELKTLSADLEAAQTEYQSLWREIRNASPLYRQRLARTVDVDLDTVRKYLGQRGSALLFYYLGSHESCLIVMGENFKRIYELRIPQQIDTKELQVEPGPLTRDKADQIVHRYMADVRTRRGGRGLGGIVYSPKGDEFAGQGTILASVLVPLEVRELLGRQALETIIIIPDGALHQLPFESLLIQGRPKPRYLLDEFPPIAYAPSLSILLNLHESNHGNARSSVSVLTIGNPKYDGASSERQPEDFTAQSRVLFEEAASHDPYMRLRRALHPLPATQEECKSIAGAFQGDEVTSLIGADATEKAFCETIRQRQRYGGYRYIHLAAHGLVDDQFDNLFGSIALTLPTVEEESEQNDGFLSVRDIHTLPLLGCELAVLSACQTNVGPQRPLEAGSTLTRAFLAAGAKRVICSHWNVADESTAQLMKILFEGIAQDLNRGVAGNSTGDATIDYAKRLHEARRRVRQEDKWSAPYYWAPFVLVGPAQ